MNPGWIMIVGAGAYLAGLIFAWEKMIVFRHVQKSVNLFGEKWGRIGQIVSASIGIVIGVGFFIFPPGRQAGRPAAAAPAVAQPIASSPTTTPPTTTPEQPQDFRNRIAGAGEQRTTTPTPSIPNSFQGNTNPSPGQTPVVGAPSAGVPNASALPPDRAAVPPATATAVPVTPLTSVPSNPRPQPTQSALAKSSPSPAASSSTLVAKPVSVAEAPESWSLPKPVLHDNGQILDDKALKAISLSLRKPEAGESVTSDTPLEVGSVILAEKKGAGLRLAAVREVKETGALSISFLGDKAAPIEVTRADLKLPAESIRNLVIASGWSIPAKMPLSKGMLLETERSGNRFRTISVIESLADGKVKVHYMDWGAETVARSTLRFPTGVTVD